MADSVTDFSKATDHSAHFREEEYHHLRSVEELTQQNIHTIARLEEAAKARRPLADRVADKISDFCGSMIFVWVHVA